MSWKGQFPKADRYFETENGILYCGDCLEIMKEFPEKSIDLIVTDPPYMISQKGKKITRTYEHYKWKRRSDIRLDFGEWDRRWETQDEFLNWTDKWFGEATRLLKDGSWIYVFFDKQKIGFFDLILAPKYGLKSRTVFVWAKTNPVPSFKKVNWNSATEFIWVGSKGNGKIKNFLKQKEMSNFMLHPNKSSYGKTEHPTEKPEKLIDLFVRVNSYEGDIVLDPFIGSGTTAIAAEKLGRRWVGIEINQEYCEIAKNRILKEVVE